MAQKSFFSQWKKHLFWFSLTSYIVTLALMIWPTDGLSNLSWKMWAGILLAMTTLNVTFVAPLFAGIDLLSENLEKRFPSGKKQPKEMRASHRLSYWVVSGIFYYLISLFLKKGGGWPFDLLLFWAFRGLAILSGITAGLVLLQVLVERITRRVPQPPT